MPGLVFLKLGGSLITAKTRRYTPRLKKLRALAEELRVARTESPDLKIILGHGSGSFGHYAVQEHLGSDRFPPSRKGGRQGDPAYWAGFAEVWYRASQLNRHVVDALHAAGVPAVSVAPSSAATTSGGKIISWDLSALRLALSSGTVPLIFGDIVFDEREGGKVLSTEVLMWHLAHELKPHTVLLAGLEEAVWEDFPKRSIPLQKITPSSYATVTRGIGQSHGPDVTGGMRSKVEEMLNLVQSIPGLSVRIFSGKEAGNVLRALRGEALGTLITCD